MEFYKKINDTLTKNEMRKRGVLLARIVVPPIVGEGGQWESEDYSHERPTYFELFSVFKHVPVFSSCE